MDHTDWQVIHKGELQARRQPQPRRGAARVTLSPTGGLADLATKKKL